MAGAYQQAARALLRDTLLDALGELLGDREWAKVTMADVARLAGVSRQTLYNEFGGRQELAQAYVLREADRFLTGVEAVIEREAGDPQRALTAAFELFLASARDTPLVAAIAGRDGGDELLALVTVRGGELLQVAAGRLTATLLRIWPEVAEADARVATDTLVRLAISHAALPGGDPADAAGAVAAVLGPFVERALQSPETLIPR
jgi:AcrR family transcriptional regulator